MTNKNPQIHGDQNLETLFLRTSLDLVSCTGMTGIAVRRPGNDADVFDEVDDDADAADDNDMVTVNDGFDHNNVCLQVHLREAWCNH